MKKYIAGIVGTLAGSYLSGSLLFQQQIGEFVWPHLLTWLAALG